MEGVNLVKIHCKHFCKYHNVPPVHNNMLIKIFFKNKEKEKNVLKRCFLQST
jgi:hypothetical protein